MIEFYACGTHDQEGRPSAFAVWAVGSEHDVKRAVSVFDMEYLPALSIRKHYAVKEVVVSESRQVQQLLWDLRSPFEALGVELRWFSDLIPGSPHPSNTNTFDTYGQAIQAALDH
ncbi:predicted protein [Cyanophage PSS2]|uniref:hypothetical protein n=1 Tax=Cyanophage PSS2 TaxID=658401 RepID=UPI0001B03FEA|nr:hypothetical protein PSS2_gp021 [Cyanophage PSS2]ACT65583.1 hypothetical protein [Cyanophage PSS2]ACY75725.1 predicted protein [Cyanophage PSS2]